MGMRCEFVSVGLEIFEKIESGSISTAVLVFAEDDDPGQGESAAKLLRLNIDKSWHGLNFLLSVVASKGNEMASQAILGGREIGEDVGYGPARLLSSKEVALISKTLDALSFSEIEAGFDSAKMEQAEIYPGIWQSEGAAACRWLMEYYRKLVNFYRDVASRGEGILSWLD